MKKSNILLISLTICLSITLVFGITTKRTNSNRKMEKTALLNPKYSEKIERIIFDSEKSYTILQKKQKNNILNQMSYFMSYFNSKNYDIKYDNIINTGLKCDNNMTSEFIQNMTNVIFLAKVDTKSLKKNQIVYANHIQIYGDTERKLLDLSFSKSDSTETRIFIKNNLTDKVYSAKDEYSKYFTMEWKDFLNKSFFPEELQNNISSVQQMEIVDIKNGKKTSRILQRDGDQFQSKLLQILPLQSNQIALPENWNYIMQEKNLTKQIKVEDGMLNLYNVALYETDGQFFISAQGILYKISEWTYLKILDI